MPVYECARCLAPLCERIDAAVSGVVESYEIVLVDDRSPDGAWEVIVGLAASMPTVRGIRLTRNFGQHAAITAGLADARGRWVAVMDCDLQDKPEDLPRLLEKRRDHEVILARRRRRHHSLFRRVAARTYFWLLNTFVKADISGEYGSFSIVSRRVADNFVAMGDRSRHYMLALHWLGYERVDVDVVQEPRPLGSSSYSFGKLVRHALDGIFFQTTLLLRWIVYLGFTLAAAGVALAAYLIVNALVATAYPGWTSLAVLILLIGGFIIITTGVAGLYVGQIFDQVKRRPLYLVDSRTTDPVQ